MPGGPYGPGLMDLGGIGRAPGPGENDRGADGNCPGGIGRCGYGGTAYPGRAGALGRAS